MQRFKIKFLKPALNDIEQIADYHLMMVGHKSAEKITDSILDKINLLEEHPFVGSEHPDSFLQKQGYRKLICGDYVCVYKLVNDIVYIYRVVHGATDYPKLFR
jgi:toxin ParE1/3/4